MNIKFHSSVVACGLAFALGVASPAIALASDTTVNGQTQNESAVVSQALQDNSASIVQEIPQAQLSPVQSDVSKEVGTVTTLQEDSVPSQSQSDELPVQEEASLEESKSAQTASANNELPQAEENKLTSRGTHTSEEPVEEDPLPALPEDGWHTNEDGTLSYYKNGAFLTGLQILGDDTYYFGEDGRSRRWTQNIDGNTYYFDGSYKMHKGLLRWNATKDYSYFDELDGRAHTGLYKGYYFGEDARSKRWTQNIEGNTYYFDGSYKMHKGLLRWNATKDYSYFGDADGVMIKDSFTPSRTYYMGTNGRSVRWTQNIDGNTYYFDGSYKMHKGLLRWNATKDYSYFGDADGVMIKDSFTPSRTYYMGTNGRSLRWTQNIEGSTYYFNEVYKMYKGLLRWAATKDYSYFGNDGAMVVGRFVTPATNRIYYFNDAGRSLRWTQVIGDHTYYFGSSYLMHTGWLRWNADNTFSYFEDNPSSNLYGVLYTGAHTIDGISYNFGDEGKVQNAACWVVSDNSYTYYYKNGNSGTFHKSAYTTWKRIQHMKSGTQYFGAVDIDNTQTTFYQRTDNVWEPIKSWACSVGNERFGTGTPRGVWHVTTNKKVYAVAAGTEETPYTCYYWTVFTNDYRSFHSIPCYPGTKRYARGSQGRLRRHISSGCVRLKLENAYWIYRIIKKGTTVYIF